MPDGEPVLAVEAVAEAVAELDTLADALPVELELPLAELLAVSLVEGDGSEETLTDGEVETLPEALDVAVALADSDADADALAVALNVPETDTLTLDVIVVEAVPVSVELPVLVAVAEEVPDAVSDGVCKRIETEGAYTGGA